jgi:Zn-dependent M16 (insulinase) family peptidase
VYFELAESGDVVQAYAEAQRIVDDYLEGRSEFNDITLEAARSSVIYRIISMEETKSMAASIQFVYSLQGVVERYHQRELLDKIARVTKEDMRNALAKYLKRLFDPTKSNLVLCTASSKVKGIAEQFKGVSSRDVTVQQDLGGFFSKK